MTSEEDYKAAIRCFIKRCYEIGVECAETHDIPRIERFNTLLAPLGYKRNPRFN